LCQAYAQWLASGGDSAVKLVLAGGAGWLLDLRRDVLAGLPEQVAERIVTTGYVIDDDVPALYSGALALVFPSLYEGFGFPVVEAMRCGTPVICANTSSLPELAGEAGLLVDPLSVSQIAGAMARVVAESRLRAELAERGYRQSVQFTWEAAARQVMAVLTAL
jgi:glycosyltransferase involved in cell wall biosynthesis